MLCCAVTKEILFKKACYLIMPFKTIFEPCYGGNGVFSGIDVYEEIARAVLSNKKIKEMTISQIQGYGITVATSKEAMDGKFYIKVVLADTYIGQVYEGLNNSPYHYNSMSEVACDCDDDEEEYEYGYISYRNC